MMIGPKLKAIRELRGWNQGETAEKAGISQTHLSQIERGKIAKPHLSTIDNILTALGVNVEGLMKAVLSEVDQDTFVRSCKDNSQFL